jgi:predicted metalloprotease with PDZ domain
VMPYDWAKFLRARLDSRDAHAPLVVIENSGYRLKYGPTLDALYQLRNSANGTPDFWFSAGLRIKANGEIVDVLKDGVADKAGAGPGMKVVAINGRAYSAPVMRAALKDTTDGGPAVEMILENTGYFRVVKLDYHGGERYPSLDRVSGTPALLDQIIAPLVK